MEDPIISHLYRTPDGKVVIQTNAEHQNGVAQKAFTFAQEFGMGNYGYILGLLHDKGKEREAFQQYIRGQHLREEHTHAYIGGILTRNLYGPIYDNLLTNPIISHHRGLYDTNEIDSIISQPFPKEVDTHLPTLPSLGKTILQSPQQFHHLTRMLFSCLVDADYLDTEVFMNPQKALLRKRHPTIEELYPLLQNHLTKLNTLTPTPINRLRQQVQQQCLSMADSEQGFYSLTVPTGGGKTLASLLWAMKHMIRHHLKRIIIAIPYTTIITQTATILKDIFGEENVLEHHSDISPDSVTEQSKLASENWDYPIIVTTNVQLFESMFSNQPSRCRKLHNIVNSVIILDEAQTLPLNFLQPIVDSLKTYQQLFGVSVLFTTASQPLLNGFIKGTNPKAHFQGIDHITEIIPTEWQLHNQLRRVEIKIDDTPKTYDEIVQRLLEHPCVLCIVNTRKEAREIYQRMPQETIHLSRMMCSKHLKKKIQEIKQLLSQDKPIRVISTQLVEAGVDIDFPIVFREETGLDSILQAAGRCNREGRQAVGKTYVFSLGYVPSGSMSKTNNARKDLGEGNDWLAPQTMKSYFEFLDSKYETFDKQDITHDLCDPTNMAFETVAQKFQLIEDNGTQVIVNWGNSIEFVEQLKKEGMSYFLMKQLSQYSVTIHQYDFDRLKQMGIMEEVIKGIYVITDKQQYDENIGLRVDNHWQEEILVI